MKKKSPVSVMHWACWKVARADVKSQKHVKVQHVHTLSCLTGLYLSEGNYENDYDGMQGDEG
jgi:hypothetical protein